MAIGEFGRRFERTNIDQIEAADRQRGHCEADAETLGVVEKLLFERQIERIVEIDASRQQLKTPRYRRVKFFLSAAIISGGTADAADVKRLFTKQGKEA